MRGFLEPGYHDGVASEMSLNTPVKMALGDQRSSPGSVQLTPPPLSYSPAQQLSPSLSPSLSESLLDPTSSPNLPLNNILNKICYKPPFKLV